MNAASALIIEDNADTARLLGLLMGQHGWQFEHVALLAAGIKRANEHPYPEVILLDLNLPDSPAVETVRRLPELMRNGPVVVLSNYEDHALIDCIAKMGGYFCPKEIDSVGAKRIFDAMIQAIRAWRGLRGAAKKQTSRIDLNLLEMKAISSALNSDDGRR